MLLMMVFFMDPHKRKIGNKIKNKNQISIYMRYDLRLQRFIHETSGVNTRDIDQLAARRQLGLQGLFQYQSVA